jgi:hypothetical protein
MDRKWDDLEKMPMQLKYYKKICRPAEIQRKQDQEEE